MASINKPHSKFQHGYAVVRVDFPINRAAPENSVSVLKVFRSEEEARTEVSRLQNGNNVLELFAEPLAISWFPENTPASARWPICPPGPGPA